MFCTCPTTFDFPTLLCHFFIRDGTPVLDIKPYVPYYDSIGPAHCPLIPHATFGVESAHNLVRVPSWVSSGLSSRRSVSFSLLAEEALCRVVSSKRLEFYGAGRGISWCRPIKDDGESEQTAVRLCIEEVLASDVRSAWQTAKAREGRSQADRSSIVSRGWKRVNKNDEDRWTTGKGEGVCTQQIDNMLVYFVVEKCKSYEDYGDKLNLDEIAERSGFRDHVTVEYVELMERA
uniref:TsaA-like domain-containing protein n=1 Tax=Corethron hystrix TaxID=216773 RepID=A0A7S1B9P3_9STRA|mmetsp:Transcript_183/g.394  ORF Transcript_183/g.394 Transcript_183/m.394 type:complete len:233 (+) Transcript_183:691-1389(+)